MRIDRMPYERGRLDYARDETNCPFVEMPQREDWFKGWQDAAKKRHNPFDVTPKRPLLPLRAMRNTRFVIAVMLAASAGANWPFYPWVSLVLIIAAVILAFDTDRRDGS